VTTFFIYSQLLTVQFTDSVIFCQFYFSLCYFYDYGTNVQIYSNYTLCANNLQRFHQNERGGHLTQKDDKSVTSRIALTLPYICCRSLVVRNTGTQREPLGWQRAYCGLQQFWSLWTQTEVVAS